MLTQGPGLEVVGELDVEVLGNVLEAGLGQRHPPRGRVGQTRGVHPGMLKLFKTKQYISLLLEIFCFSCRQRIGMGNFWRIICVA